MAMIELEIDGYGTVEVDEKFKKLSTADQQKTVEEIVQSMSPKDTSLSTAFQHGDLKSMANTQEYAGNLEQVINDSFVGDSQRYLQENIGNPVREFFGFDPLNQNAMSDKAAQDKFATAEMLNKKADALNYKSLTTDDVTGIGSGIQYGAQKMAESLPYMMTAVAPVPGSSAALMSGEAFQEVKDIEGVDQATKVSEAGGAGILMGVLENIGAGFVMKLIPSAVKSSGAKGISSWLTANGFGRIATAFTKAAAAEGLTEVGQDIIKMGTAANLGKDYTADEVKRNLKESFFAGAAGGGGTRGGAQTIVETVKGTNAAIDAFPSGYKKIVKADEEATAEVVRDLEKTSEGQDRNNKKLDDADANLDDLHTQYQAEIDALVKQKKLNKNNPKVKVALKRAKNKVKNLASKDDIKLLTDADPQIGALARKLNVITRFKQEGVKGGVSKFTDYFNPLNLGRGKLGININSGRALGAGALAYMNPIASATTIAGGRVIDALTGSRNRVSKAIRQYQNAAGINIEPTNDNSVNVNPTTPTPITPVIPVQPTKEKPKRGAKGKKKVEKETTTTTAQDPNGVPDYVKNPLAYKEAVNRAVEMSNAAVKAAPNDALKVVVLDIANQRTPALKKAKFEQAKMQYPEHATFLDQVVEPMTQFGPKEVDTESVVQESRFPSVNELKSEAENYYGERVEILHHGTSKDTAQTIEQQGFNGSAFMTAIPEKADGFAQDYRGQPDNGRTTTIWPRSVFERLVKNGLIKRNTMEGNATQLVQYEVAPEAINQAYDTVRTRSLFKPNNKLSDKDKAALIARALTEGFKVNYNSSQNSFIRRQQLINLTKDADKTTVLHEIFHAVEDRLSKAEMDKLKSHPLYDTVKKEVQELYPELSSIAQEMEVLAEMSARLENARYNEVGPKYILGKIKDLIERFLSLLKGDGFMTVNSVLDNIYTGKTYQQGINEEYAEMMVPTTQFAKVKHGSPMLKKRREDLDKIQKNAIEIEKNREVIDAAFNEKIENLANNLDIEGINANTLKAILGQITPDTDVSMLAVAYLKAIDLMEPNGRIVDLVETKEGNEVEEALAPHRENFLIIMKALQESGAISDFEVAFRTSAGGVMYPIYTVEPKDSALKNKADQNNARKYVNRATKEPRTEKPKINGHPLGSYDNTVEFIEREQQQPLVINDMIYKLLAGMMTKPRHYRGLDLVFKKDGTTDSAYTLAAAEALKQYEDNQTDKGGMSPVYMLRRAQDRLRIDTLNGSASYQGKAGKAIWEFPNWRPLGATGFESFLHSIRDHLGIGNEIPYNQRAGILFGTVQQYMDLAGRPRSEFLNDEDLNMPLIDYLVAGSKMKGGNIFAYQRGGAPMIFNDKRDAKTIYQKNHAVFDVSDHGFEIQRLAVEIGRMRAFLEGKDASFKKIPTSELFQNEEAINLLQGFNSAYPVWFDGTSSAYQLHAALTGDPGLSQVANLLSMDPDAPGGDLYRLPADHIQEVTGLGATKSRKVAKKFLANRRSYGQVKITARGAGFDELAKQLPEQFNDMKDPEQKETLKNIQNKLELIFDQNYPGAAMAEGIAKAIASTMFDLYGKDNFAVRVPLPDGDVSVYTGKLPDSTKRRVNWEIGKDKKIGVPVYQDKLAITGFAAFLNHSLDAYVQRALAKRLRDRGVPGFMHTHDAFATHPVHGQEMREIYHEILLEIASSPIYEEVVKANGIDPDSVTVKYNVQSEEGSVKQEMSLSEILNLIRQMKDATFSNNSGINYYALS